MRKDERPAASTLGQEDKSRGARIARPHEQLQCWKDAVELVADVYKLTELFPSHELYGLSSQMRRAAVSIPSNIAEGVARHGPGERRQFLFIARGSLSELETQVIIAERLDYIEVEVKDAVLDTTGKVGAMLNGLLRR